MFWFIKIAIFLQLLCGARTTSDLNSKLKSPNLEFGKNDEAIGLVNNSTKSTAENEEQKKQENQHQGPSDGPSSSVGLGRNRGPIDIPDLNLPSEDFIEGVAFQPLDVTRRNSWQINVDVYFVCILGVYWLVGGKGNSFCDGCN